MIDSIQGSDLSKAYCASCYGADGKGDGPMAESLKVKPAYLTRIAARNVGTFPLMRIERIICGEGRSPNGHGSGEMPVWGRSFHTSSGIKIWGGFELGPLPPRRTGRRHRET
jgi:hypothetical protein